MLRLNKKTEYALLALRTLAACDPGSAGTSEGEAPRDAELVNARLIAGRYRTPEMLLAKVLQKLKRRGLVAATKGSGGGYRLARPLSEVPLLTILELFDEHVSLVECHGDDGEPCQQLPHCDIKGPLAVLSAAVMEPLRRMSVEDLFVSKSGAKVVAGPEPRRAGSGRFSIVR
jgi:Rrf2 family nitric oxide-sensitive transcriptional repressor